MHKQIFLNVVITAPRWESFHARTPFDYLARARRDLLGLTLVSRFLSRDQNYNNTTGAASLAICCRCIRATLSLHSSVIFTAP